MSLNRTIYEQHVLTKDYAQNYNQMHEASKSDDPVRDDLQEMLENMLAHSATVTQGAHENERSNNNNNQQQVLEQAMLPENIELADACTCPYKEKLAEVHLKQFGKNASFRNLERAVKAYSLIPESHRAVVLPSTFLADWSFLGRVGTYTSHEIADDRKTKTRFMIVHTLFCRETMDDALDAVFVFKLKSAPKEQQGGGEKELTVCRTASPKYSKLKPELSLPAVFINCYVQKIIAFATLNDKMTFL